MQHKWTEFFRNKGKFYLLPYTDFEEVIKYFKSEDVLNVLDIGCGSGRHLIAMAQEGFSVTGIDFSPAAGQIAEQWLKEKDLEGKVYVADFHQELSNFKTEEFDSVIAINSLQYIDSPEKIKPIFAEINRIVKTGGPIFIVVPSEISLIIQPDVMQVFFDKTTIEPLAQEYFDIVDLYKDKEKSWVIMAKNKSNIEPSEGIESSEVKELTSD